MATNEQLRRGIGATNESARRAIGSSNEAARRAGGAAMVAQRTGRSVIDDLNSVVTPTQQGRTLATLDPRGSRPAARGIADYKAPAGGGKGGGIAGPLQETDVGKREYFEYRNVPTSDGLFVFLEQSIKMVVLRDANNVDTEFIYLQEPV